MRATHSAKASRRRPYRGAGAAAALAAVAVTAAACGSGGSPSSSSSAASPASAAAGSGSAPLPAGQPGKGKPEKIPTLKPAFAKDGTITAASSSSISNAVVPFVELSVVAALATYIPSRRATRVQPMQALRTE